MYFQTYQKSSKIAGFCLERIEGAATHIYIGLLYWPLTEKFATFLGGKLAITYI